MAQVIQQVTSHVSKTGIATQHARISATAAASLGALCVTAGTPIPTLTTGGIVGTTRYPSVVTLQVESGGGLVYYTLDGSTPTATNGLVVPVAPTQLVLPYPDLIANTGTVSATNQQIQLFAGGATPVQILWEWW